MSKCEYTSCKITTPHSHGICGCIHCTECGAVIKSCMPVLPMPKMISKGPCKACGNEIFVVDDS